MICITDMLLALYDEHQQRTGHDVIREDQSSCLYITCSVCMWLKKMMAEAREKEAAEAAEKEKQ